MLSWDNKWASSMETEEDHCALKDLSRCCVFCLDLDPSLHPLRMATSQKIGFLGSGRKLELGDWNQLCELVASGLTERNDGAKKLELKFR